MDYKYLLEEKSNKNLNFNDIVNENGICYLNILCYHVETQHKYPFLQFMMEKIPFCDNIVKEEIICPYIYTSNTSKSVEELVLDRVTEGLKLLGCDYSKVSEDMYKGIVCMDETSIGYALVNISDIDIYGINFNRQTTTWFVLPSEIINNKDILSITIESDVINLFTKFPFIGCLSSFNTNEYYIIPDVVYTKSELKQAEFESVFGVSKNKEYNNCSEYYFFNRALYDIGWFKEVKENNIYVNRYALFVEGKIYLEKEIEFSLTDEDIENLYPEPCIMICYLENNNLKSDMLVKNYDSFISLSYHKLGN